MWIPDDMLTDDKRYLYLSDSVGLPVEHVPRELAPIFRSVLEDGAQTFGDPVPSTHPWPEQHEPGGGIVLPCHYIIQPVSTCFEDTLKCLLHDSWLFNEYCLFFITQCKYR